MITVVYTYFGFLSRTTACFWTLENSYFDYKTTLFEQGYVGVFFILFLHIIWQSFLNVCFSTVAQGRLDWVVYIDSIAWLCNIIALWLFTRVVLYVHFKTALLQARKVYAVPCIETAGFRQVLLPYEIKTPRLYTHTAIELLSFPLCIPATTIIYSTLRLIHSFIQSIV